MKNNLYFPMNFIVLSDYEIKNGALTPTAKALTDYMNGKYEVYNPISDEQVIYMELCKLASTEEEGIIKFVKNFGIPSTKDTCSLRPKENHILNLYLDVTEMVLEINLIESRTKLWNEFRKGGFFLEYFYEQKWRDLQKRNLNRTKSDIQSINEIIDLISSSSKTDIESEIEKILSVNQNKFYHDQVTYPNIPVQQKILEVYVNKINKWNRGHNKISLINNQITKEIIFTNLFQVAYYQLSEAILQNKELKHCENCGHLFEPAHGSQKFCSPLPGRKRSTCENTYNQRLKRQRKKEQARK